MTKQEGAAFAERLTRIWTGNRPMRPEMNWSNFRDYNEWDLIGGQFQFFANVHEDAHFVYVGPDVSNLSQQPMLMLVQIEGEKSIASIEWRATPIPGFCFELGANTPFADKWLFAFRRGCWLSGCDIEASAHEKAEWMQDFTPEELQGWDLKI